VKVFDGIFWEKHGIFLKLATMYKAVIANKCINLKTTEEVMEGL
jgi:hypothetical protein